MSSPVSVSNHAEVAASITADQGPNLDSAEVQAAVEAALLAQLPATPAPEAFTAGNFGVPATTVVQGQNIPSTTGFAIRFSEDGEIGSAVGPLTHYKVYRGDELILPNVTNLLQVWLHSNDALTVWWRKL